MVALKGRPLQKGIIELAHRLGWRVAHTPPIKGEHGWRTAVAADGKGFPDLVLVRERVVWAEVKGDSDRMRPEQLDWQTALRLAGQEVYVWTPDDWAGGAVEDVLRRRSHEAWVMPPHDLIAEHARIARTHGP